VTTICKTVAENGIHGLGLRARCTEEASEAFTQIESYLTTGVFKVKEGFLHLTLIDELPPGKLFELWSKRFQASFSKEKWLSERLQYQSWITELLAMEARAKYFYKEKAARRLVVARPLECISLIQFAREPAFIGSYIRSSDQSLVFMDLAFLLALPYVLALQSRPSQTIYSIDLNFYHTDDRVFKKAPAFKLTLKHFEEMRNKIL
jgi:hypothetical protein